MNEREFYTQAFLAALPATFQELQKCEEFTGDCEEAERNLIYRKLAKASSFAHGAVIVWEAEMEGFDEVEPNKGYNSLTSRPFDSKSIAAIGPFSTGKQ